MHLLVMTTTPNHERLANSLPGTVSVICQSTQTLSMAPSSYILILYPILLPFNSIVVCMLSLLALPRAL